jgi:uncharacterized protein HemX
MDVDLFSYQNSSGGFGLITLNDIGASDGCTKVNATTQVSSDPSGRGGISVLLSIDKSACDKNVNSVDGIQAGAIAAAVIVPVAAIGIAAVVMYFQRAKLSAAMKAVQEKLRAGGKAESSQKMQTLQPKPTSSQKQWQNARPESRRV